VAPDAGELTNFLIYSYMQITDIDKYR